MRAVTMIIALALLASPAAAEQVYSRNGVTIHFRDVECDHEAAARSVLGSGGVSPPKKAVITIGAQYVAACWAHDKDGDFLVRDRAGKGVTVYADRVRNNPGI